MPPCLALIPDLETNLGLPKVSGFVFSVMPIGVAILFIEYNLWLKRCLSSVCVSYHQEGLSVRCLQNCWERSVLFPGWIITIRQSCASRWESPTGSTPVQTQIRI